VAGLVPATRLFVVPPPYPLPRLRPLAGEEAGGRDKPGDDAVVTSS
jgi:hypothetical protein